MLYEHAQDKVASSDSKRSEFGEIGLGATVSHKADLLGLKANSGGGGIGVQDLGGGGGGGAPSNSYQTIAGSVGSGFRPIGRTTSPFSQAKKIPQPALRRNFFQPSSQGPRISGGYPAVPSAVKGVGAGSRATFPAGGLYGLGEKPISYDEPGLGGFFSWVKQRFTPPSGGISKIQLGRPIAQLLPTPVRSALRYVGATTQSILAPVLTGSQQRSVFGLSPSESGVFMKAQQVFRVVDAAILTAGAAYYLSPAYANAGLTPYTVYSESATSGIANATNAASLTTPSVTSTIPGVFGPAGIPGVGTPGIMSGTGAIESTPFANFVSGSGAISHIGMAPMIGSPTSSWGVGALVKAGLSNLGKAALDTAMLGAVSKFLSPGMSPQIPGTGSTSIDLGGGQAQPQAQPQVIQVPVGGGSGGGYSDPGVAPVLAGVSLPMVLTATGILITVGVHFLKRKKR